MSVDALIAARRSRIRRRTTIIAALGIAVVVVYVLSLMVGKTFYGLADVIAVIRGEQVPGASFTVGDLRLPRASAAVLAGIGFGVAGASFQTMLRNPLASPDIIGISAGASAAAVTAIVIFSLAPFAVSLVALAGGFATAGAIYLLSHRNGFSGTRLILIGIGIAAFLDSVIAYVLSRAAEWDMQTAMQWLTGSLNSASWPRTLPLAVIVVVAVPLLVLLSRELDALRMGDDMAAALGVRVTLARVTLVAVAVAMLGFATAACGPIAFLALMAGPIAIRIVGAGGSVLLPAALTGALLVLLADLAGQFAFDNRYPVGVVTGALGAPVLLLLLIKTNRSGGSL